MPLRLNGTFSFFHSRKPTDEELQSCDKIFITPDSSTWNPYCTSFALNEELMLNFNGDISDPSRQMNLVMDVDDNDGVVTSVSLSAYNHAVDSNILESFHYVPSDDDKFLTAVSERAEISKVVGSIGSVRAASDPCNLFAEPLQGTTDKLRNLLADILDDNLMAKVDAIQASSTGGVTKEMLSKIWVVSEELAQGAIDQNTQLCKHHADNSLSRQFSTNDRMLCYKRLKSVFFTDTLVSLSTKSTRGNNYA